MSTILAVQACNPLLIVLIFLLILSCIPGQLIPFIIGIASLPSAIWGAFENYQDFKEEESHEMKEVRLVIDSILTVKTG